VETLLLAKQYLNTMGCSSVRGTSREGEELYRTISELKPRVIFMESAFYGIATPYRIGVLHHRKPYLNIAVFSLGPYPGEREKDFILRGAKSYISLQAGREEFERGMRKILKGEPYIAPWVEEQIEALEEMPDIKIGRSEREREVLLLLAGGKNTKEISQILNISRKTVENHKTNLFAKYHARNAAQMVMIGISLGMIPVNIFSG
jgi:DNA-binding NarL/FixJ family response regulator